MGLLDRVTISLPSPAREPQLVEALSPPIPAGDSESDQQNSHEQRGDEEPIRNWPSLSRCGSVVRLPSACQPLELLASLRLLRRRRRIGRLFGARSTQFAPQCMRKRGQLVPFQQLLDRALAQPQRSGRRATWTRVGALALMRNRIVLFTKRTWLKKARSQARDPSQ